MIRLIDLLNEGKQVGLLYHFTDFRSLLSILKSNSINGSWGNQDIKGKYISATRDKNFWKTDPNLGVEKLQVGLMLDGDKLSNRYTIRPYAYEPYRDMSIDGDTTGAEAEELIMLPGNELQNVKDYLVGVVLLKPNDKILSLLNKQGIKVINK